ncbi:glycosyltransferase [Alteromonas sp. 345S023]|uniref:Glycosyltransferase n=1 Tax=Alteromonas profundi TaxID=2696062 RepID=A0A7X5RJL7_9ALTE|nr:glycosyltransferase family 2 protein [Alteromonas profundi]NDV89761.1 glycosyltransferase [Alteromonas profundi]
MICSLIIVLYNPDPPHVQQLIDGFSAISWPVVLVDNSPESHHFTLPSNAEYLHFPQNKGIAAAQNAGLERAFTLAKYAVLLDQDSHLSASMAQTLLSEFMALEKTHSIAAIGPSIHCEFSQKRVKAKVHKGVQLNSKVVEAKQIIASGMLLSKASYLAVGKKEEGLFIDGVDHEWCWRAQQQGFVVFQSLSVCMPHRQGDDRVKILGLTFKKGAPIRLYYQMRNILVLARRDYVPLYWKFRHLTAIPLRYLVNRICFENGKLRGRYMRKGLRDGRHNKQGRCPIDP